jgi:hypothetical protein
MKHRAASRFNEKYKMDKCPICRHTGESFIMVSEGQLGCRNCGCVFVARFVRDDFNERLFDILSEQEEDRSSWNCGCGFTAKSKAGLMAHGRTCGDYAANGS